jgi:hypothetical protein
LGLGLKKMSYKLETLISNGENHKELFANNRVEIDVLDEIPFYSKLHCKNALGPARFTVKYK